MSPTDVKVIPVPNMIASLRNALIVLCETYGNECEWYISSRGDLEVSTPSHTTILDWMEIQ